MSEKAMKFDDGKIPLEFLELSGIEDMCKAFQFGAKKYSKGNYKQGMEATRLTAAAMRHILQWQMGVDMDDESGISHLGHAMACLSMISTTMSLGTLIDDRECLEAPLKEAIKYESRFPDGLHFI